MVHIAAVQSTFPPHYYDQEALTQALVAYINDENFNARVLERMHKSVSVKGRYLALPMEAYLELNDFKTRNKAWGEVAVSLGQQCVEELLKRVELGAKDIAALYFNTVTGLAVPSIDAQLMNRLGFRSDLKRVPLFGLGCVAGAAGIARVTDYLVGHPKEAAILLCVELCSFTVQKSDLSVANMISSGLFGDGVAGVLMVGSEHPLASKSPVQVVDTQSVFFPNTEYVMGWDFTNDGFKIVLSADVPKVAKELLPNPLRAFLARNHTTTSDVSAWASHPGGPKVIDALEEGLEMPAGTLDLSRKCLSEIGNLSSASVLVILEQVLAKNRLPPGSLGVVLAMGPGFCAEAVLIKW